MDVLQAFEIVLPLICPVMTQSEREHWLQICNECELRNPDGARWLRERMMKIWSETDAHTGIFTGLTMWERLMAQNLRKQMRTDTDKQKDEIQSDSLKDDDEPKTAVRSPPT